MMVKSKFIKTAILLTVTAVMFTVFYACAQTKSAARLHPMTLEKAPVCSDCHDDERTAMNHTADWNVRHKFSASRKKRNCGVCHAESFCTDCHASKEELKPSKKYKDSPERAFPHRGDYISRHKIDGRINPASCLKCHGRQNNKRCKKCHK